MEGSGEEGDLEGSDSEAAQWADQEQWFGMQWWPLLLRLVLAHEHTTGAILLWRTSAIFFAVTEDFFFYIDSETIYSSMHLNAMKILNASYLLSIRD